MKNHAESKSEERHLKGLYLKKKERELVNEALCTLRLEGEVFYDKKKAKEVEELIKKIEDEKA